MNRFDRALGILLLLRSGQTCSATELARRFEVSPRTIYRDIEALSALGVPVYAEQGRGGGFRLLEGYFLPPITFSTGEATSLLAGLAVLRRLRARPFAADLAAAGEKLLAALPEPRRAALERLDRIIAFEPLPHDSFHPDLNEPQAEPDAEARRLESEAITTFLRCILEGRRVGLEYQAPGRQPRPRELIPHGLLWDRDRWYLVGRRADRPDEPGLWRADRVRAIRDLGPLAQPAPPFEMRSMQGRQWLSRALQEWAASSAVTLRLTAEQAERLQRDWYYGHARFEAQADGAVRMTYGEMWPQAAFALLRWLGPGAELLEPRAWREAFAAALRAMLAPYAPPEP